MALLTASMSQGVTANSWRLSTSMQRRCPCTHPSASMSRCRASMHWHAPQQADPSPVCRRQMHMAGPCTHSMEIYQQQLRHRATPLAASQQEGNTSRFTEEYIDKLQQLSSMINPQSLAQMRSTMSQEELEQLDHLLDDIDTVEGGWHLGLDAAEASDSTSYDADEYEPAPPMQHPADPVPSPPPSSAPPTEHKLPDTFNSYLLQYVLVGYTEEQLEDALDIMGRDQMSHIAILYQELVAYERTIVPDQLKSKFEELERRIHTLMAQVIAGMAGSEPQPQPTGQPQPAAQPDIQSAQVQPTGRLRTKQSQQQQQQQQPAAEAVSSQTTQHSTSSWQAPAPATTSTAGATAATAATGLSSRGKAWGSSWAGAWSAGQRQQPGTSQQHQQQEQGLVQQPHQPRQPQQQQQGQQQGLPRPANSPIPDSLAPGVSSAAGAQDTADMQTGGTQSSRAAAGATVASQLASPAASRQSPGSGADPGPSMQAAFPRQQATQAVDVQSNVAPAQAPMQRQGGSNVVVMTPPMAPQGRARAAASTRAPPPARSQPSNAPASTQPEYTTAPASTAAAPAMQLLQAAGVTAAAEPGPRPGVRRGGIEWLVRQPVDLAASSSWAWAASPSAPRTELSYTATPQGPGRDEAGAPPTPRSESLMATAAVMAAGGFVRGVEASGQDARGAVRGSDGAEVVATGTPPKPTGSIRHTPAAAADTGVAPEPQAGSVRHVPVAMPVEEAAAKPPAPGRRAGERRVVGAVSGVAARRTRVAAARLPTSFAIAPHAGPGKGDETT